MSHCNSDKRVALHADSRQQMLLEARPATRLCRPEPFIWITSYASAISQAHEGSRHSVPLLLVTLRALAPQKICNNSSCKATFILRVPSGIKGQSPHKYGSLVLKNF